MALDVAFDVRRQQVAGVVAGGSEADLEVHTASVLCGGRQQVERGGGLVVGVDLVVELCTTAVSNMRVNVSAVGNTLAATCTQPHVPCPFPW